MADVKPTAEAPLYDALKAQGIVPQGAVRWNREKARDRCSFPVLEQLLYDHSTGAQKWVDVPVFPDDYSEKPNG